MTKRRADNSTIQESPHKKKNKCGSVCDTERVLEAVHVTAAPPAFCPTLTEQPRRKRPRCCEDYEQLKLTRAQEGKMSSATNGGKKETGDECASEKFSGASSTASEEIIADTCIKTQGPADNEDDLCVFNSFQFWRVPLPALDFSLLDEPSEEMET